MLRTYTLIKDKVVAAGENEVLVFANTDKNDEKIEAINSLKVANKIYEQDVDDAYDLADARDNASKHVKKQVPFVAGASVLASYLLAHLSVMPYDGDVKNLIASWAIHSAVLTGASIAAVAYDSYKDKSLKDLEALKKTIKDEESFIMETETDIEDIDLEEPTKIVDKNIEDMTFFIDADRTKKRVEDTFNLDYVYYRYHDKLVKAYYNGKLDEFLNKIGLNLECNLYEELISKIEDDLYESNKREYKLKLVK